jgi:pimeloyl-ACP methyl ester carboxylesterase
MTITPGTDLHVDVWGMGETVLFVHANCGDGTQDWVAQSPLADRYRMLLLDRRGYGDSSPRATPATCAVRALDMQAQEIADLLGEGAHLVGHSSKEHHE